MLEKKLENSQLFFLTSLTLIFLAANSILCRAALVDLHIDSYSFTFFRLFFGSLVLFFILLFKDKKISLNIKNNWISSFMLFLYAISFSYSYIDMDAGIGTLILFAIVQLTMIIIAVLKKEQLTFKKVVGIGLAFFGLVYLLFPNEEITLSTFHLILMIIAGIAWAFYTILGKKSTNALKDTTDNFIKSIIYSIIFFILFIDTTNITPYGIFLAFLSGGITSGIGYALWYTILKDMKIITASVIQLIVPVIAIFLSVILLNEQLTYTLVFGTILILGGIYISIYKN